MGVECGEKQIEVISILERKKSFKVFQELKEGRETQTVIQQTLLLSHVTQKICSFNIPWTRVSFYLILVN